MVIAAIQTARLRHCERSEAISTVTARLLRCARNDEVHVRNDEVHARNDEVHARNDEVHARNDYRFSALHLKSTIRG